jgi:hypothetical protein
LVPQSATLSATDKIRHRTDSVSVAGRMERELLQPEKSYLRVGGRPGQLLNAPSAR